MAATATGDFRAKVTPLPAGPGEAGFGRLTLTKTYSGDLVADSEGLMLAQAPNDIGSGAYVALERITGTLAGRSGSFMIVNRGVMTRKVPSIAVIVIPDSGTEGLAGITGTMTIDLSGGGHRYTLTYELPPR